MGSRKGWMEADGRGGIDLDGGVALCRHFFVLRNN